MNSIDFVAKVKKLVNTPTYYAKGCFGQKATEGFINQKAKQYPAWYTASKIAELKALDDATLLADCIGMIKYILWQNANGTVIYTSNGVPDIDETTMFKRCKCISSDFTKIEEGEMVWMKGHVGIYVGKGIVVEMTNAWEKCVLESSFHKGVTNHYRVWEKHGKLPYIDYVKNESPEFSVQVDTDYLEVHKQYDILKVLRDRPQLNIVETKENFGRLEEGGWIDLTKCRRIKEWM